MKITAYIQTLALLCLTQLVPSQIKAQSADGTIGQSSASPVFNLKNISIRKTFDGSKKDEEKPANFFWGRNNKNDFRFTTFDLGLKLGESIEFSIWENSAFLVFPKFEWHRDDSDQEKKKNTLGGGVNVEFFPVKVKTSTTPGYTLAPWVLGSVDYQNDYEKALRTIKSKAFLSFFGTDQGLPGSSIRKAESFFRYYPYSGFESYMSTDSLDKKASYWASRLFIEIYPFQANTKNYVQFTGDYTYRVKIKDSLYDRGHLYWVTLGLNLYPDGKGKIGFGLEYSLGDDPTNNFVSTDKIILGLKFKI